VTTAGSPRRALIAVAVAALLVAAYAYSFLEAQATPAAHLLPVGLAGPSGRVDQAAHDVRASTGQAFEVHRYADEQAARRAIDDRKVYAALVLVPAAKPKLLTAPAAGQSAEQIIERRLPRAAGMPATTAVQIVAVKPLVKGDEEGQALNLMLLPLVIFSIVLPLILASVAAALTVRARLALIVVFAVLAGVAVTLVANVWLDAVPGPFLAQAGVATLTVLAAASVTLGAIALLGPVGAGIGIVLFLVIGNVASGASVTNELMPGFWRTAGPWLPPGAAATAFRNIGYFDSVELAQPLAVLAAFAAVGIASCLVLGGRRPAPQGDPAGPTPDAGR
jgi:hypothetical protein